MSITLEYNSNNSGGSWWLDDEDWKALEKAGWNVKWVKDEPDRILNTGEDDRWLGALAKKATIELDSEADIEDAISEWESITGQSRNSLGCNCCGPPHEFEYVDENGKSHYGYAHDSGYGAFSF